VSVHRLLEAKLEYLTAAAAAEMLQVAGKTLTMLKDWKDLSKGQSMHIAAAERHIVAAVGRPDESEAECLLEPTGDEEPQCPSRGLDGITTMLHVFHEHVEESDFTRSQRQRILVAAYNLATVAQELMTNVH
jgi:hypothetical protein